MFVGVTEAPGECGGSETGKHGQTHQTTLQTGASRSVRRILLIQLAPHYLCVLYTALLCVIVCEACGADVCVSVAEVRSLASDLLSKWMGIFKEGQSGI